MLAILLEASVLGGCNTPEGARPLDAPAVVAPTAPQPDLVLLLMSGLRADAPRGPSAEAAFFEAFGPPPARYTAAYAQSPAAFVSLGSILTGRYPSSLPMCGLYTAGLSGVDTKTVQDDAVAQRAWCAGIPESTRTLPEVLGLYGYHSALATSGLVGAELLARGFGDTFAADVAADGAHWNALDAWTRQWWEANAAAPRLLVVVPSDLQVGDRADLVTQMGFSPQVPGLPSRPPDGRQVHAVYTEAARTAGAHAKSLVDGIGGLGRGVRERWTFVTSTNGWSLDETMGFTDLVLPYVTTSFVLDRTVHVPLAVYGPAAAGGTFGQVVELIDLLPTLHQLGGAVVPVGLSGRDLVAARGEDADRRVAYAEFGDTLLVRRDRDLLQFRGFLHLSTVLDPQVDERLADTRPASQQKYYTLYDVIGDPYQTRNLATRQPALLQELRAEMIRIRSGPAAPPADTWADPQRLWEIRMARTQGYW